MYSIYYGKQEEQTIYLEKKCLHAFSSQPKEAKNGDDTG